MKGTALVLKAMSNNRSPGSGALVQNFLKCFGKKKLVISSSAQSIMGLLKVNCQ